jgi:PIN domain nuclease of toxin-antitoxin system
MPPTKPLIADASAVIAYLDFEPGADLVARHLPEITITAVNLAEIVSVLTLRGIKKEWIETRVLRVFDRVIAFDRQLATVAGSLVVLTQEYGLSLGDRACLAAGVVMDAKVLTADSAWGKLNLGIDIHLIR